MTTQVTLSSPKPARVIAGRITAGAGWRLGLLYGPAVYGVSAAAVALPDAARHLHASGPALAWLLTAYAVGIGVGAVTGGRMIDLWGDRPVLLIAVTLLTAGTLACVVAPNLAVAVTGRILLAVGSGAVKATSLATAARLPASQRPTALARFGACLAAFGATAPLAGALAAAWSWRVALALPVLSIAAIPLCWPLTTPRRQRQSLDWPGAGLLAAVAAGPLLTAQTAAQHTSALTIAASAAATAAAALALAIRSRRRTDRFVVDGVLAAPWFRRAALAGAGVYAGLFAVLYAAPHLLTTLGYSTMDIGLLLLPGAAVGAGLARGAAVAARRLPARHVLSAASLLLAGTLCYAALDPRPLGVASAATAAFATSATAQMLLTAEVTRHVSPQQRGGATGLLMLAIFTGGGGGTALCAALWQPCGPSIALALAALLPAAAAAAASRLHP
ncbi:Major Facilitator Superfamily protein [Micromonospora peucetia]|uniref:Major Facilitator Superfamily protein n=1 Tax=Micromonospora peucetia TaxID=47871 RepID=A0A1C6W534_9ACTN|nr:Major Facilitator Superfamily protein [Micromonospora peucetia]